MATTRKASVTPASEELRKPMHMNSGAKTEDSSGPAHDFILWVPLMVRLDSNKVSGSGNTTLASYGGKFILPDGRVVNLSASASEPAA